MADRLPADHGGSYRWQGNVLHIRRVGASGHLAVTEDTVEIQIPRARSRAPPPRPLETGGLIDSPLGAADALTSDR
jgi:hypothetical protein